MSSIDVYKMFHSVFHNSAYKVKCILWRDFQKHFLNNNEDKACYYEEWKEENDWGEFILVDYKDADIQDHYPMKNFLWRAGGDGIWHRKRYSMFDSFNYWWDEQEDVDSDDDADYDSDWVEEGYEEE